MLFKIQKWNFARVWKFVNAARRMEPFWKNEFLCCRFTCIASSLLLFCSNLLREYETLWVFSIHRSQGVLLLQKVRSRKSAILCHLRDLHWQPWNIFQLKTFSSAYTAVTTKSRKSILFLQSSTENRDLHLILTSTIVKDTVMKAMWDGGHFSFQLRFIPPTTAVPCGICTTFFSCSPSLAVSVNHSLFHSPHKNAACWSLQLLTDCNGGLGRFRFWTWKVLKPPKPSWNTFMVYCN